MLERNIEVGKGVKGAAMGQEHRWEYEDRKQGPTKGKGIEKRDLMWSFMTLQSLVLLTINRSRNPKLTHHQWSYESVNQYYDISESIETLLRIYTSSILGSRETNNGSS